MSQTINLSHAVLLCIDMQAGVINGDGTLILEGAADILPIAKKVLGAARKAHLPIIHAKEVHRKEMVDFGRELDGTEPIHCLETWLNTDFHPDLKPIEGEFSILKRRYSCFFGTDLEILLRGLNIDTLILIGTMTDVCVHYTAADAHQRDYHFHVIEDCCAGSNREAHGAALKAMAYLQSNARLHHQDVIQALATAQRLRAKPVQPMAISMTSG